MRRSPLRRRTPLRRLRWMRRKPPRRPGGDPGYLDQVRGLPCSARYLGTACRGPVEAHHPRHLAPGMGRKSPDRCAIPLCAGHHRAELHGKAGAFRGWPRGLMRAWQDEQVAATQMALGGRDE